MQRRHRHRSRRLSRTSSSHGATIPRVCLRGVHDVSGAYVPAITRSVHGAVLVINIDAIKSEHYDAEATEVCEHNMRGAWERELHLVAVIEQLREADREYVRRTEAVISAARDLAIDSYPGPGPYSALRKAFKWLDEAEAARAGRVITGGHPEVP